MENLARQTDEYPVFQDIGFIKQCDISNFLIAASGSNYNAEKAAGCLLQPEEGDRVLFTTCTDGACYILMVLEKCNIGKNSLHFQGDTEIVCKKGKLQVVAQNGINLTSPEQISLTASGLKAIAEEGECSIGRMTFLGNFLLCKITSIKILIGKIDSLCDLLLQKVKNSYREVENLDHLKAGKVEYCAEKLMSLRGKYSILTAQEDVKIDGERIHMG